MSMHATRPADPISVVLSSFVAVCVLLALPAPSTAQHPARDAEKWAQRLQPQFAVGPFVTIDNGVSGDGRLEVAVGRGGEASTIRIDPPGAASLQDILFELHHYVDVGAGGGAVQLGNTTSTAPTLVGNQVRSTGTFSGASENTIAWTAVSSISPGTSRYVTTLTFTSNQAFGPTRIIQYADIDVFPLESNHLIAIGAFNQPDFQLVTVQAPESGSIAIRQFRPQVSNANCVGWAARPFPALKSAIEGTGASYSPGGVVSGLSATTDSRFPGSPAFGPDDITAAIACDLNPGATTATVVFALGAEAIDTTPPATTILSGPSGTIATGNVSFTWTGEDNITPTPSLNYAVRLEPLEDFSPPVPVTNTFYTALPDGDYTFEVKAVDLAGNEDPTPARRTFQVRRGSAPVTDVGGSPQVNFQGNLILVTQGFLLVQGMELRTGAGGSVGGNCGDGRGFSVGANASLFLDGPLCPAVAAGSALATAGSGFLDLTQGEVKLTAVGVQSLLPTVRTPISRAEVGAAGADFTTVYTVGQAVTTVNAGSVSVTNVVTGAVETGSAGVTIITGLPGTVPPLGTVVPQLAAAVLPSSRSVQVGATATAFATIINAGITPALICQMSPVTSVPATFSYQTTNAANQVVGAGSTPISITGGGLQAFVIAFTPTQPFGPTEVQISFNCGGASDGANAAALLVGVNTLLLSASSAPVPDIVALGATEGNLGIVNIPGATGIGAFAVATVNVGVGGSITVSADTGNASLPVTISLCQTNPATGACLASPTGSVTTVIGANTTPTFAIFVTGAGEVPFDPATNRIFVRFKEAGVTRGSTSVAVRTQ